jgi:hypothetical protein
VVHHRTTSAFGDDPRRILSFIQLFGKHCNCLLQSEYVKVGRFWRPYVGQAVGCKLDLVVMIVGAEELPTACPI